MIIDCISDLHGHYPKLEGGDLLIVSGDLTARHTEGEHFEFNEWLENQNYKKIILVAGNHDTWIEENDCAGFPDYDGQKVEYLSDSETQFEGLKIWGSPWTRTFEGMNPHCKAFTLDTEEELANKWALIPEDTDILITHSPPYGIFDKCKNGHEGSESLRKQMFRVKPKIMVFGHIHECGGSEIDLVMTKCVNASIVNEHYEPVNEPIRVKI